MSAMLIEMMARALGRILLVCSLLFVVHLYPLPGSDAERAFPSPADSSVQKADGLAQGDGRTNAQAREAMELLQWRAWLINAVLLVAGLSSSCAWILSDPTHNRRRLFAVVGTVITTTILAWAVLLSQPGGLGAVIAEKVALIRQLASAGVWSFVAAEGHRITTLLVALATTVFMALAMKKTAGRETSNDTPAY